MKLNAKALAAAGALLWSAAILLVGLANLPNRNTAESFLPPLDITVRINCLQIDAHLDLAGARVIDFEPQLARQREHLFVFRQDDAPDIANSLILGHLETSFQ